MSILTRTANTVANRLMRDEPATYDLEMGCEDRIEALEKAVKRCEEAYIMLIYDIPSHLTKECPNPSKLLWRHGFRLNLSCWVLPKAQLDHPRIVELLERWKAYRIETHAIEYAESQREKIQAIAVAKLEEEIRRQHTSLIANIASADEALVKALADVEKTPRQRTEAEAYRDNRVRAALRTSSELLEAAICCANMYDDEMKTADLLKALKLAIASQKNTFNAAMKAKGGKGV